MKYLKLFESVTPDSEIIRITSQERDEMTEVGISDKEVKMLRNYFKQYPTTKVKDKIVLTKQKKVDRYCIWITRGSPNVWMVIRKYDDEWWLVHHNNISWKCDQWSGLIKCIDQVCSKLTKKKLDQIDREEKESIENQRILDMRRELELRIRKMSVEDLEKWHKQILGDVTGSKD